MNIFHLSADEILRICQPQTDLEIRLFALLEESMERLSEAEDEAERLLHCYECDTKEDMVSDLKDRCDRLEELLDRHGVKYK